MLDQICKEIKIQEVKIAPKLMIHQSMEVGGELGLLHTEVFDPGMYKIFNNKLNAGRVE